MPEVEAARAAVFELIGRNVLRFQKLELLLKHALARSNVRVTDADLITGYKPPDIRKSRETLGVLAGRAYKGLVVPLSDQPANARIAPMREGARIQFEFTVRHGLPPDVHSQAQTRFRQLVTARNELVHVSLFHFDMESASGCAAALAHLEQQAIELKEEIEYFISINRTIDDCVRHMNSPEAKEELLKAIRESTAQPDSRTQ